ncbi:hypothetical protein [Sphaerisporangium album]|nr:hypothetical protein [Sphaerisporangium album]
MSFFTGLTLWSQGDRQMALLAGSCSVLFVVSILTDYYRRQ